jgi:membrane protein implicated in regulation of membrane protease activity
MAIEGPTFWWVLAGTLVAVELATGTFYLLMLALGAVAGAAGRACRLQRDSAQIVASALLGALATLTWHVKRARNPRSAPAQSNPDVLLDIGQTLSVEQWARRRHGAHQLPRRGLVGALCRHRHTGARPAPHRLHRRQPARRHP